MTGFGSVLRKEAREHRLVLGVLGALTLASCVAPIVVDVAGTRSATLPGIVAGFAVLAVALTIAPSLVPSEIGEGLRFLGRLPVRPRTVFLAKLTFLFASAALVAGFGFYTTRLAQGALVAEPSAPLKWSDVGLMASPLVAGFWLMAITCVIPRALAAIPAGAVGLLVTGGPIYLAFNAPLRPWEPAIWALGAMAVLAPLSAAYLGFKRMIAGGPTSRGAIFCVIGALSCFVLPAWAWSGWERWRYENLDPTDSSTRIKDAFVSADGSRAYLNGLSMVTNGTFVVDLVSGKVIGRGGPGRWYLSLADLEGSCMPRLATHDSILHSSERGIELVDCATGRARTVPLRRPSVQLPDVLRADLMVSSAMRSLDGRRFWVLGDRLEVENAHGGCDLVEVLPSNRVAVGMHGGAVAFQQRVSGQSWLPSAHPTSALELGGPSVLGAPPIVRERWQLLALPRAWLFVEIGSRDGGPTWKLRDEPGGAIAEFPEISPNDRPIAAVDECRVLFRQEAGALVTFDLGTRELAPVVGTDGAPAVCERAGHPMPHGPLRGPEGQLVLAVARSGRSSLALFDPASNRLSVAAGESTDSWADDRLPAGLECAPALRPLRWESPAVMTVLVDHSRITRVRFGTADREVLFPRN